MTSGVWAATVRSVVFAVIAAIAVASAPNARAEEGGGISKPLDAETAIFLIDQLMDDLGTPFTIRGRSSNGFGVVGVAFHADLETAALDVTVRKILKIEKRYEKRLRKVHALYAQVAAKGQKRVRKILKKYEADPALIASLDAQIAEHLTFVDEFRDEVLSVLADRVAAAIEAVEAAM